MRIINISPFVFLCGLVIGLNGPFVNASTDVEHSPSASPITHHHQTITYFKVDYQRVPTVFHSQTLSFREQTLTDEDIRIMGLGACEEIDLASTNIKRFGLGALKPSRETLLNLDISGNFLDSKVVDDLLLFNHLQVLNIGNNLFKDSDLESIAGSLSRLQELDIHANSFTSSVLPTLIALSQLESLNCGYMDLGNEGMKIISQLPGITHLYVRSCNFNAGALQYFLVMPKLQFIDISYNKVNPSELRDFSSKTKATVVADFMSQ